MNTLSKTLLILLTSIFSLSCKLEDSTNVCVFPDTQNMAKGVFIDQIESCLSYKPKYAIHLGDVVSRPGLDTRKWEEVSAGLKALEVPFSVALGNHDFSKKNPFFFLKYFDHSSYPWVNEVTGDMGSPMKNGGTNLNHYSIVKFSNGLSYLVLTLEWFKEFEGLETWVNKVMAEHKNIPTIVVTHDNLTTMAATVAEKVIPEGMGNCGPKNGIVWEKLIAPHRNIFLVVNGHAGVVFLKEPDCATIRKNNHDLPVVEMLVNYQHRSPTEGCYRILEIDEYKDKIKTRTYCTGPQAYETDENSEYAIPKIDIVDRRIPAANKTTLKSIKKLRSLINENL